MDRPPQDTPRKLCQGELDALEARRKVTNAAMRNFVGDTFSNQAAEELPRVAVCFSGEIMILASISQFSRRWDSCTFGCSNIP